MVSDRDGGANARGFSIKDHPSMSKNGEYGEVEWDQIGGTRNDPNA